ncbi:tail fiber assembly protein [Citrobacter sp. Awk 4]|uniref:tail fiber assembly protein n=1 Tax=Citrobacter sp. Awk 4 TaxID=2963955 RepID=UPI0023030DED|nr:tail fiber assembly protein [Citrobacter sp. Awk 4]MDA8481082.1 tail fiber assembly protein [Citrobacter sp. Awk 4]
MANFYYSSTQNLILWKSLENEFRANDVWPNDAAVLTDEQASEFMNEPPEGKIRVAGDDGLPAWADAPPPTREELIAGAENKKHYLIVQASDYMSSKQWPGKAAMGRLKDTEKAQYNDWLDYLDALEEVDTSRAPDIEWPTPPEE